MKWMSLIGALLLIAGPMLAQNAPSSEPIETDVCELALHRDVYNHKIIRLDTLVSHGFEDFALMEPSCDVRFNIWVEYGGTSRSGTIYCCGVGPERTRPEPLIVESIPVPLIEDDKFAAFDKLVHKKPDSLVHAVLVGTFFAGEKQKLPQGGWSWHGYGHMGCCSVLVIRQVLSVDPQDRSDLDYSTDPDQPDLSQSDCGSYRMLGPILPFRRGNAFQREAEAGAKGWAFDDPARVAKESVANILKLLPTDVTSLKKKREAQGRLLFNARVNGSKHYYLIVLSRPYWLSFYARDSRKIAWVVIAMYESDCK